MIGMSFFIVLLFCACCCCCKKASICTSAGSEAIEDLEVIVNETNQPFFFLRFEPDCK